jgi:hypothetical protein
VFHWQAGRYQALTLSEGKVWLPEIQLGIGLWHGAYQGLERQWLRWYDVQHHWIFTPVEREQQRTEQERQRAERLAAQLRALGIEPQ